MKAKRRQELKTNDLAHALEELAQNARDWGVYLLGAVVVIVAIFFVANFMRNAKVNAIDADFASMMATSATSRDTGERKGDIELMSDLEKLNGVAATGKTDMLRRYALVRRGQIALGAAETAENGIDPKFLDIARDSFSRVVDQHADHVFSYGRALYGLFQIEADAFSVDQDPAHRANATGYLEKLRDDARFNGTPFQTRAVDMLNDLDSVFTVVTFAKRPEISRPTNPFSPSIGSMIQVPKPDANRPGSPISLPVTLTPNAGPQVITPQVPAAGNPDVDPGTRGSLVPGGVAPQTPGADTKPGNEDVPTEDGSTEDGSTEGDD